MIISRLDHLVLTVRDIETTIEFYTRVMGMEAIEFGKGRKALRFGSQKINLHKANEEFMPHAAHPLPGSADLCFISDTPVTNIQEELKTRQVEIVDGPVTRTGANGQLLSLYIRDPDGNLVEISNLV